MYEYTFVLDSGKKDNIVGDMFQNALLNYFQWRGVDILSGENLKQIEICGYPKYTCKPYNVNKELIEEIVLSLKKQNAFLVPIKKITPPEEKPTTPQQFKSTPAQLATDPVQQKRCQEMKKNCPEGSNQVDPIMQYEDWCDDIPYQEFVKQDNYLSQCYRLTNLINAFNSGLEAIKQDNPFPQWPIDPIARIPLSPEKLYDLYTQAQDAKIDIPTHFAKFVQGLRDGQFDVKAAMAGQYIGGTDHINPRYMDGFVKPAVALLFEGKKSLTEPTQEEKDLQMAIQLAEQFGYQS